jgi:hypothetical protein
MPVPRRWTGQHSPSDIWRSNRQSRPGNAAKPRRAAGLADQDDEAATLRERVVKRLEPLQEFHSRQSPLLGVRGADCFHIDHPAGEEMNEWQPIETAPRDGMEILLFARGQHNDDYMSMGQWSEQSKDWFWSFAIRPTHWMPLPDQPIPHRWASGQ